MSGRTHCLSIPKAALKGASKDLREQLRNEDRVEFGNMSAEAEEVIRSLWDPKLDGTWPPSRYSVVVGIPE